MLGIVLPGEVDRAAPALLGRGAGPAAGGGPHPVDIEEAGVVLNVGPPDAEEVIGLEVATAETLGGGLEAER